MINKAYLDGVDVLATYGYYMTSFKKDAPNARRYTVEVPGKNGVVDYTDFFGEKTYNNINIEIEFKCLHDNAKSKHDSFINTFINKTVKLKTTETGSRYYEGYLTVPSDLDNGMVNTITINIDAYPFLKT